nr:nutritionally-regulated adipose and cardiac enriched protein homolog [Anolis sagrei ordinatus]
MNKTTDIGPADIIIVFGKTEDKGTLTEIYMKEERVQGGAISTWPHHLKRIFSHGSAKVAIHSSIPEAGINLYQDTRVHCLCYANESHQSQSSILRKSSSMNQEDSTMPRAKKSVRFRESEEIIPPGGGELDYIPARERPSNILPVFLGICLFCMILLLAAGLYYSSRRHNFKVLEEFHSQLVIVILQIRHVALKCWTWFVRQ